MQDVLDRLAARLAALQPGEGVVPTPIPFLSTIRFTRPNEPSRGVLAPSLCLLLQGRKRVYVGATVFQYAEGEYLVSTVEVPAGGQVLACSPERPYLAVRLALDAREIADIALEAKLEVKGDRRAVPGTFAGTSTPEILDAVGRLLALVERPRDAAMLAGGIKREILYRLLTGEDGHRLYQNILLDHREQGVGKAIHWIRQHYAEPLVVEQLAKVVNMSVSSLHHKFKDVTAMGPLQYQKQLRLQEARRLLSTGALSASMAAQQVGYDSESQFSREYRRLFGAPPMRDARLHRERPTEV